MKILGLGESLGFGQKFSVWAKNFGLGEKFGFERNYVCICILHFAFEFPAKNSEFWVCVKILGWGQNFGFGGKF